MLNFFYTLIIFPVEQVIELCYVFAFRVSESPGLSVLGVSIAVSTLVLPIYLLAEKQQQAEREKQKQMKGEIDNIKAVFKGDKRYMLLSTLYRQHNYHPVYSLRNSIDLFIQIPFFIAAYHFLHNLTTLGGQHFFFIKNLGAPDGLIKIGGGGRINILPVLMTLINCISGAIYTKGFPRKEKIQIYGMAVVFLILLYNAPAALVLYWTSNNVYNLVKNILQRIRYAGKIITALVLVFAVGLSAYILIFLPGPGALKKRIVIAVVLLLLATVPFWKKTLFSWLNRLRRKYPYIFFNKADAKTYILSCMVLCFLIGLVIPAALISSSVQEFSLIESYTNPLLIVQNTFLQSAGLFVFWLPFIYFLSDKKIRLVLMAVITVFMTMALFNTFIFKGDYGSITNTLKISLENNLNGFFFPSTIANIIIALAVFILVFVSKRIIINSLQTVLLVSCMVFGTINIIQIKNVANRLDEKIVQRDEIIFPQPEYTFSKTGKNVLFIMLDRGFSGYVSYILEERPELREVFSGFIFYPNTVSFAGHTLMGASPVFGGYEYTPQEMNRRDTVSLVEKHNEALLVLPKLFLNRDFTVTVSDPVWSNFDWTSDLSIFDGYPGIHAERIMYSRKYIPWWNSTHTTERAIKAVRQKLHDDLIRFSFFRASLPFFRLFIYDHGRYLEARDENNIPVETLAAYTALDILPEITGITEETANTYNCIYNDLPHQPTFFQFPDYDITQEISNIGHNAVSGENLYHVNMASFLLLAKWFSYLKQNGIYDNTRVVIVSDHGLSQDKRDSRIFDINLPNGDYLNEYTPLLLVKDFYAKGLLQTDDCFMTNADAPLLALKNIIENPANPFTQKLLKEEKKDGVIITTSHKFRPEQHEKFRFSIKSNEWLHVHDNIFDPANWSSFDY
jgi:YidC/Oxa1 family membrane protein insertase